MPELDLEKFFVAEVDGLVVGVAGYTVLEDGEGKTTLMAVDPAYRRHGLGRRLQEMHMLTLRDLGCRTVTTNADLPETIAWYKKNFAYEEIGTLPKIHEFGDPGIGHWTTIRADIERWYREIYVPAREGSAGEGSAAGRRSATPAGRPRRSRA